MYLMQDLLLQPFIKYRVQKARGRLHRTFSVNPQNVTRVQLSVYSARTTFSKF